MKLLLDTHILLWALADDPRLTPAWRQALEEADHLYISAASVWEIAIKRALGKLTIDGDPAQAARDAGCLELPITWAHARTAGELPAHHADPFDRMLIAQAHVDGLTLITADRAFAAYGVAVI